MQERTDMSKKVQSILGRAINDKEFRELILRDIDAATKEYELSEAEKRAVSNLQENEIQELVTEMARRMKAALLNIKGDVMCDGQCA